MKTAITIKENNFESEIDHHFARCSYFAIFDSETGSIEFMPNPGKDLIEDAGPATVQLLKLKNVARVVSGDFGQKVKPLLDSSLIQMIIVRNITLTVSDIILFLTGKKGKVMPKMDKTGPDGKGGGTGRGLGRCGKASQDEKNEQLGKGMKQKRKVGGGQGKGKRLQSGSGK